MNGIRKAYIFLFPVHFIFIDLDPDRLFGVNFNSVIYLLEQLFGAQNCRNYNFKYHQYDITDLEEVRL